ncbi:MAG: hypothetical protein KJ015_19625 [Myxococcales bacterium]|nr:hypothetical protein [Myxococcales bacterium]
MVLGAHGRRVTQYWDPLRRFVPLPSPRSALEHIQHLRSQLLRYLERELDPNGGNLLLLSGGVDSSILAVLSRHSLNRPLMTLSLVPPDGHPARLGEVSLINRLGDRLGVEHRWFFGTELDHLESALVAAPDSGFHFFHFMLALVPQLRRERAIRVVLGGDFADDLFGGPQLLPAWAAHAPAGSLLLRDRLPVGRRDWARWAKHRARKWTGNPQLALPPPLSAVFAPAVRLEHAEWAEATKGRLVSDERPFHHLAALLAQRDWVVTAWEASAAVGVHRALPFLSREAIELAAVLHPVEHFGPGTKKALRAAAGEIPPKFLERHEKLHWSALGEPDPLVPWGRNIPEGLGFLVNPQLIECPPPYVRRSERSSLELLMLFADRLNRRRAQADLRSAD